MKSIQKSIEQQCFPEFVRKFMADMFSSKEYPQWIVDALMAVDIYLDLAAPIAEN
jgi:queuine tRNA-ribosyltransferase